MFTYLLFLGLFLAGLAIRWGYELRQPGNRVAVHRRSAYLLVFTAMTLMWVGWFNMGVHDPVRVNLPLGAQYAGFGLSLLGIVLFIGPWIQLRRLEGTRRLVTTGFFRFVRHPVYIGFVCWIVGEVLRYGALASLIAGVLLLISLVYWIRFEEARLLVQFGNAYRDYQKRTLF